MAHKPTPNWQPINFLPKLAEMVDGMLESAEDVSRSLQQAQDRPHVLDDYTVGRIRDAHITQRNDLWLYEEQLSLWQQVGKSQQIVRRLNGYSSSSTSYAVC